MNGWRVEVAIYCSKAHVYLSVCSFFFPFPMCLWESISNSHQTRSLLEVFLCLVATIMWKSHPPCHNSTVLIKSGYMGNSSWWCGIIWKSLKKCYVHESFEAEYWSDKAFFVDVKLYHWPINYSVNSMKDDWPLTDTIVMEVTPHMPVVDRSLTVHCFIVMHDLTW